MNSIKRILYIVFCSFSTVATAQYISVDDSQTAQQLIENVLVKSSCVNVTNFHATGDTFIPGQNSYGSFNYSGTNFPFANGGVIAISTA